MFCFTKSVTLALKKFIQDADVVVDDYMNDGNHFSIVIHSNEFKNKTILEQHKMVHSAIKNYLGDDIIGDKVHAIQIITKTKD